MLNVVNSKNSAMVTQNRDLLNTAGKETFYTIVGKLEPYTVLGGMAETFPHALVVSLNTFDCPCVHTHVARTRVCECGRTLSRTDMRSEVAFFSVFPSSWRPISSLMDRLTGFVCIAPRNDGRAMSVGRTFLLSLHHSLSLHQSGLRASEISSLH